jgi:hypothetical protein
MNSSTLKQAEGNMSNTQRPRRTLRSVGAVVAGFLTIAVLSTATDTVLHLIGVYPSLGQTMSDALFVLALSYRIVYGVAGCYVAAWLAPDHPMRHAAILGAVGVILSTAGAIAMWDAGPSWYSLAVIGIALPCAWAGGRLRVMQLHT